MSWPQATDYNAAVQNPQVCFGDDELRQGQVVGDMFGLPRPHSGNFADVYQIQGADKQSWAIKCFTRPVAGLHQRYQAICTHLRQTQLAFMVDFRYLEEGIRIRGQWYPLVKMRWVDGFTLNEFIHQHLDKPVLLERLAQMWIRLGEELRNAGMAHGDLQHGNVLLVPGGKSSSLSLKLIDYDGMFVPALAATPSGEVGHPNYQHPQRLCEGAYDPELDHFAHLLIYTALRCLRTGGAELWQRYDNLENLLFREEDFRQPAKSRLLRDLWSLKDREARDLVGHLLLASQGPLLVVPMLDELVDDHVVRPLSGSEEMQVKTLLGEAAATPRKTRAIVTAISGTRAIEIEPAPVAVLMAASPPDAIVETIPEGLSLQQTKPSLARLPSPPPLSLSRPSNSSDGILESRQPTTAPHVFAPASLMDPVVSLLSRPTWLTALGAIALVSFAVVNVLVWSAAKAPPSTAPIPQRPHLHALEDVTIKGGHKRDIPLILARRDCSEPLRIQVEGLPGDMKTPPLRLAPEVDTVFLPLLAPLGGQPSSQEVCVSLWQDSQRIEEQTFHLSVQAVPRPTLVQPESIHAKVGTTFLFIGRVDRHDCRETLRLHFEGLPDAIRQESLPSRGTDPPRVVLAIASDAQTRELVPVSLQLRVGDVVADTKPLFFIAEKAASIAKLKIQKVPDALTVEAGEKRELRVFVERGKCKERLEIRLDGLPIGATAKPAIIPADLSSTTVTIETTKDIGAGERAVNLKAWVEEQKVDETTFTLRVQDPASLFIEKPGRPREAQPERVTFTTVDGVQIVGTLYPGSKGKKGACVLMLPELGKRNATESAAWQRLAEAVQAKGHTVLSFDYRGQGASTSVTATVFWNLSVNKSLPAYNKGNAEGVLPETIQADDFSPRYMPWLIHDIAAARMFLDMRHEDPSSPVNSANLLLFGVGRGAALGSLWLASEGIRYDAKGEGAKVKIVGLKNQEVLRGVWLDIETAWRGQQFPVSKWVTWAHRLHPDSVVPIDFLYGAEDLAAARLARNMIGDGNGNARPIRDTNLSGWQLLKKDGESERYIQEYLTGLLNAYPLRAWTPRHLLSHHSYWGFPTREGKIHFYLAKRPGERLLHRVPLRGFGVEIVGLDKPQPIVPSKKD